MGNKMNKRTRDWAANQSKLQYERSLSLMNMQNAYNTPEQQRKRLEEAGLNVGLMYGSNGPTGTSADAAAPQIANYAPIAPDTNGLALVGQAGSMLMQNEMMKAQVDKLKSETGNIKQDTKLKEAVTKSQDLDNIIKQATTPQQIMQAQADLDKSIAELKVLNADELLKSQQQMKLANDVYW